MRRIKLIGARFDGGRLPIDSLVELERYQELLRVVARAEWRGGHPGEPLPAHFDEEISLTIEGIEEGSADVLLAFEQHAVLVEYQQRADDTVSDVIAAAYESRELPPLPPALERDVRDRIVEFGDTLEAGQSIQVYTSGPSNPPVEITIETRREVVEMFALEDFIAEAPVEQPRGDLETEQETVVGRITEVDASKASYRFESLQYGRLLGHYDAESHLLDDIRKVLDSPAEAPILRVEGNLQRKRDGSPWRFKETFAVEEFVAGSSPWAARLIELAELARGWSEVSNARPIAVLALEAADAILSAVNEAGQTLPGIFPTEAGGVILEWASFSGVQSVELTAEAEFELFARPAGGDASLVTTSNLQEAIAFALEVVA